MQIAPRYDGPPVLAFDPVPVDPGVPMLHQRRRLGAMLATLDESQWDHPSRCVDWSVRDVVTHLVTVNAFWAASTVAGRAGTPTRVLDGFDPVTVPALLVDASPTASTAELLAAYDDSVDSMATALEGIDTDGWAQLAESVPGHVPISSLVLHALWDSWVHERDIAIPLGLDVAVEPDEVAGSLRYVVAMGPAFLALCGSDRTGTFAVAASAPDARLVVEIGPDVVVRDGGPGGLATVTGDAVDLVESFSLRTPAPALPGPDGWMVAGLAALFEQSA